MRYKMTNKDAIEVFEALKNEDAAIPRATFHKSLELAIDALQHTSNADEKHVGNTLDAVSREALDECKELMTDINGDTVYVVRMSDIRQLPSVTVQQTGEWIPVSERLPEEREWYLAVFKEKDTDFQLIPRVADYIGSGENKWRMMNENGLTQEYLDLLECVAWMPLPEPYSADMRGAENG